MDPASGKRKDFIMYPGALLPTTQQSNHVGEITRAVLGCPKYAGLGRALEECCGLWADNDNNDDNQHTLSFKIITYMNSYRILWGN